MNKDEHKRQIGTVACSQCGHAWVGHPESSCPFCEVVRLRAAYNELDKQFPRVRPRRNLSNRGGDQFKRGDVFRVFNRDRNGDLHLTDGTHVVTGVSCKEVRVVTTADDAVNEMVQMNARKYRDKHFASWTKETTEGARA